MSWFFCFRQPITHREALFGSGNLEENHRKQYCTYRWIFCDGFIQMKANPNYVIGIPEVSGFHWILILVFIISPFKIFYRHCNVLLRHCMLSLRHVITSLWYPSTNQFFPLWLFSGKCKPRCNRLQETIRRFQSKMAGAQRRVRVQCTLSEEWTSYKKFCKQGKLLWSMKLNLQ